MKYLYLLLTSVSVVAVFTLSLQAESREWTQAASGKKINGEYVGMKDDKTVTIKMANGRAFDVPLASLSPADNDFVKTQMAGGGDSEAKPAEPESGSKPAALPEGEVTVTLSGVHMCCRDCEEAVTTAGANSRIAVDEAVEFEGDRSNDAIIVKAPNGKAMQNALKAVLATGFYGKSDHETLKIADLKDAGIETNTMSVRDVHLCCGGCVKGVEKALKTVEGFEDSTVKEGSSRFIVTGEKLNPYTVMSALRAAGYGGSFQ